MEAATATAAPQFVGVVEVLTRRFEGRDGFAILQVREGERDFAAKGPLGHLREGDFARLEGEWIESDRFGWELRVRSASPVDPPDAGAREKFLIGLKLPGIGKKSVERLLAEHGERLFERLDHDAASVFAEMPRVGQAKAEEAARKWGERRGEKDLFVLLHPHRLSWLVKPLVDRHGAHAGRMLRENPYGLMSFDGVGFEAADRIARAVGVPEDSPRRQEAALLEAIMSSERRGGHACTPVTMVLAAASKLLHQPVDPARLGALERQHQAVIEGDFIWRAALHRAERHIADHCARLTRGTPRRRPRIPVQPQGGLTVEQWNGVRRAFDYGVSIVTGPAGTGKTTLVRAVVSIASQTGLDIALCAPTGAAARRLEQATGLPADTCHGTLEWGREGANGPVRDASDPLQADVVIVDEASMLDVMLCAHLLDALAYGTRLVFVGDEHQLPSVKAGRVLGDLIESGVVPVTRLNKPQRTAERSMIVRAAHAMLQGYYPANLVAAGEDVERDFFVIDKPDPQECLDEILGLVAERLPRHYDLDPMRDIMVLAPTHRGPVGVAALNDALSQRLNPRGEEIPRCDVRIGDRAVFTDKNVKDIGLMNGTRVIVEAFESKTGEVIATDDTEGRIVKIPGDMRRFLKPAYAMTVHKAQGQEAPIALTVCHRQIDRYGYRVTNENLLVNENVYTAITRARQVSLVVGEAAALGEAIARRGATGRWTGLAARLRHAIPLPQDTAVAA